MYDFMSGMLWAIPLISTIQSLGQEDCPEFKAKSGLHSESQASQCNSEIRQKQKQNKQVIQTETTATNKGRNDGQEPMKVRGLEEALRRAGRG